MVNRLISVDDTSYLPQSVRVGDINLPAWAKSAAIAGKVGKGEQTFNVMDEGAVADATDAGGTDNTPAFQAAMDKAGAKGGTVIIPPGAYHLSTPVAMRSNVHIVGYGATLRKYGASSAEYAALGVYSGSSKGYGATVRNVIVEGLTFRGNFAAGQVSGCAVTIHHAQNITFRKCVWTESIVSGHGIDAIGCNGILVDDCTVMGFKPQTDREYVEFLQLDYSMISAGSTDPAASYDGLPTINVTVQNSRFLPLVIGATTYPAPNPIGSHSRVAGMWIDNIKFLNNYVQDCATPVSTDGFAVLCKGWLHFFCTRNVQIVGNTFKTTDARVSRVIAAYSITTGTALTDVATAGAASVAMAHMSMQNMLIEGNSFEGFASDAGEQIIDIRGTTTVNARNIRVNGNTLKDSFSTPGVSGDKGHDFIYLQDVSGATVNDNYANIARSLLYAFRVSKINVRGGQLINLGAYITRFSTCNDINVSNLHVDGHGGGHYFYNGCVGIDVSGGSILNGRSDAIRPKHFSISGATEFSVRNIRIPADGNGYTSAIDAYSTSTKGKVKDLFASGWTSGNLVSVGSGSAVTVTENVF